MSVDRERAARVRAAFEAVADLPVTDREPALERLEADDPDVAREVGALLEHEPDEAAIGDIIRSVATSYAAPDVGPGSEVGAYRIVEQLGHGGMGTVWLAVRNDDAYRAEVAIKLMHGATDPRLRSRFEAERQILASLEHPNIARLLDGGTTPEGSPYVVMEYVRGEPVDAYCRRKGLGVEARLELFVQVCSAVQYAHRNLIVHRDIKPGNILVDGEGIPKLLDFGIAKLLDASRVVDGVPDTVTGAHLLTPRFASPEQIRGETITTASDVYALGVLLHQLLTGSFPYRVTSPDPFEIARAICEQAPAPPSVAARAPAGESELAADRAARARLARRLEGDLDNIVLKALRKEPRHRYGSAEELAEDVRRHLGRLPVIARPPTVAYRMGRFASRHRWGLVAAGMSGAVLFGATAFSLAQMRIALGASEAAERVARQQALRATYAAASARIEAREPGVARDLLMGVEPEDRGWGWRYLHSEVDARLVASGPSDAIAAGFGADASTVLTMSAAGDLVVTDLVADSDPVSARLPMEGAIRDAAFSQNGRRIAIVHGVAGGRLSIWAIEPGADHRLVFEQDVGDEMRSVVLSATGSHLVATGPEATWMWVEGRGVVSVPVGTNSPSLDISADGRVAVFVRPDEEGSFWVVRPELPESGAVRQGRAGVGVAVSPDGRELAGGDGDRVIRPREIGTGFGALGFFGHAAVPTVLVYSPDGSLIASAAGREIRLLDAGDGTLHAALDAPAPVTELRFSADGALLSSVSADGQLRIWNAHRGESQPYLGRRVTHAPRGSTIWSVTKEGQLHRIDPASGEVFDRADWYVDGTTALAASWEGEWLASIEEHVAFVRPSARPLAATPLPTGPASVVSLAFAVEAPRLATLDASGGLVLWEVGTWRELARTQDSASAASSVVVSPDGSRVVTAGADALRFWDASGGESTVLPTAPGPPTTSLAQHPDGEALAVGRADGTVALVEPRGRTQESAFRVHRAAVTSVVFSPDGARLASGGRDGTLRVVELSPGNPVFELAGHAAAVGSLSFSPDGSSLVSADEAGEVRIWNASPPGTRGLASHRLRMARQTMAPMVARAFARTVDVDAVAQLIRDDPSLPEPRKRAALQLAMEPPFPPHDIEGAPFNGFALESPSGAGYVEVEGDEALRLSGDFTVELWVQPFAGREGPGMLIEREGEYTIQVAPDGEILWLVADAAGGWPVPWRATRAKIPHGTWGHIAFVRDGPLLRLTVNGRVVHRRESPERIGGPDAVTAPLVIGGRINRPYSPNARIDDVRLWSVAKTERQIREGMLVRLRGDEAGLIAGWSFDEGRGDVAVDVKGRFPARLVGVGWSPTRRGG